AEETHHRHRFAGERGVDQLAHRARLDLHRLARVGIDELHPYVASAAEVHALLVRALAEQRRRDVADAHDLGHSDAQNALDVIADGGYAAAGFAAGHDVRQRDPARLRVALLQTVGQVLGKRG